VFKAKEYGAQNAYYSGVFNIAPGTSLDVKARSGLRVPAAQLAPAPIYRSSTDMLQRRKAGSRHAFICCIPMDW